MHVQADLHALAQGRAHGLALAQQRAHRLARLQHVARARQAPAHELVAQRARAPAALDQGLDAAVFAGIVRVADHLIADAPPEQLVDRHAVRLARDVPQRRVDRSDGRRSDAIGREEATAEEYLPEVLDAGRVLPYQQRPRVRHEPDYRLLTRGQVGFAHPPDALVGVDGHEQPVAPVVEHGIGLDVGNLHGIPLFYTPSGYQ